MDNFIEVKECNFYHTHDGDMLLRTFVEMKTVFNKVEYISTGEAVVHPDDRDLSTELVGENISQLRAYIQVFEQILKGPLEESDMKTVTTLLKSHKEELKNYIKLKEDFFQRVRNRRKDPNYYKVQVINVDEEGQVNRIE